MFRKDSAIAGLVALVLCATACSKDDTSTPNSVVNISAVINAPQQIPTSPDSTVKSGATGTVTGTYNPDDKVLKYTITHQGFRAGRGPVAGHFHLGAAAENGGVFITLANPGTSPIIGTATLTQAQADALLSGKVYVNLHTARYPNGEIRGNAGTTTSDNAPVSLNATINSAQQVPTTPDSTVTSAATGSMSGIYTPADKKLTYTITHQGFRTGRGPLAGHFHLGGPAENGAVFVTLAGVATSPITGTATLTQAQADALLADRVYVNLHTARYPNGEVRGNVKK